VPSKGIVVAFLQADEDLLVQDYVTRERAVRVAQDSNDAGGPFLDAGGAEFRDRSVPPDHAARGVLGKC
jgi:hypothetical protein